MSDYAEAVLRFQRLDINTPEFGHREHVEIAFMMLELYDFVEACSRYASTIKAMAEACGAPEKFNATITFAFMSLIAERKSLKTTSDLQAFLDENPGLLEKDVLSQWYSVERLTSERAREQFLLPDLVSGQAA